MGIINVLPTEISNKIAAGEVVERPASVVKELVENAIDAGSRVISVEIQKGGITYIRVSDNGKGMSREDAEIAFLRHATSKIQTERDLDAIYTLGFRGEALSSIGAVSETELYTKRAEDEVGTHVSCTGGVITSSAEEGMPCGTVFEVKRLFYNTPARMNFLKRDASETAAVTDIMERFILSHPEISFRYKTDGKEKYFTSGDNNPLSSFYAVYGKSYVNSAIPLDYEDELLKITGLIGKGDAARPNRSCQSFFVNGRYVKSLRLSNVAESAYKNQIMINKHPMFVINIQINPALTDINVHPTKLEVKFSREDDVCRALFHAIENTLYAIPNVPEIERTEKRAEPKFSGFVRDKSSLSGQAEITAAPVEIPVPPAPAETETSAPAYELSSDKEYFRQKRADMLVTGTQKVPELVEELATGTQKTSEPVEELVAEDNDDIKINLLRDKLMENSPAVMPQSHSVRVIGQLFDTYILAEEKGRLIIVDQHAAHERLKYEELKKSLSEHRVHSQLLLAPFTVNVTADEHAVFAENSEYFAELGFEIEDFGENALIVRATPETLDEEALKQLVLEIIGSLSNGAKGAVSEKLEHMLYTVACKAAVKANRKFDVKELEALLNSVLDLGNINTCPHGRPIIVTMTKKELEKEFKRIV